MHVFIYIEFTNSLWKSMFSFFYRKLGITTAATWTRRLTLTSYWPTTSSRPRVSGGRVSHPAPPSPPPVWCGGHSTSRLMESLSWIWVNSEINHFVGLLSLNVLNGVPFMNHGNFCKTSILFSFLIKFKVMHWFLYPPQTKLRGYIVILMSVRSFVRSFVRPSLPISNPLLL